MIKFIVNNKEWIFSGIGVTICVGIFFFVKNKFLSKKKEEKKIEIHLHPSSEYAKIKDSELIPIERISSLKFSDIERNINNALPLQKDEVRKSFIGINVMWNGYLKTATKKDNNMLSLRLAPGSKPEDIMSTIHCTVSLTDYRELGVLPEKAKIRIQGEIASADLFDVELVNVKLFFLEK